LTPSIPGANIDAGFDEAVVHPTNQSRRSTSAADILFGGLLRGRRKVSRREMGSRSVEWPGDLVVHRLR